MYNSKDDIKKEWKRELDECKAFKAEWEKVTFPTKKDGTPFKNMSKNFEGATYKLCRYATYSYEHQLEICTKCNGTYISDEIECYKYLRYWKPDNEQEEKIKDNVINNGKGGVYVFDINDIKKAVKQRINELQEEIGEIEKDIENLDTVYDNFTESYKSALTALKKLQSHHAYDVRQTVIMTTH